MMVIHIIGCISSVLNIFDKRCPRFDEYPGRSHPCVALVAVTQSSVLEVSRPTVQASGRAWFILDYLSLHSLSVWR